MRSYHHHARPGRTRRRPATILAVAVSVTSASFAGCPGAGECCRPNGTPGCDDDACCASVCTIDPFCCDVDWDQVCADAALADPACDCDGSTDDCPGTGDCCAPNGTPGCDDETCCGAVCAIDPFCCDVDWDQVCAEAALASPDCDCGPPTSCPGSGGCCEAHESPGCEEAACCVSICADDPFCCDVTWDQLCADEAAADPMCLCDEPAPCPADLDADGTVSSSDLAALLAVWGPCPGCPADLNGDGTVDSTDLAMLLSAWGPCG
ncbi:MAG: hypothetical protein KDA25_04475 [Phycisphaerales bacterium]|nr:hypothetical protein [Phycisphaerales bacterium]